MSKILFVEDEISSNIPRLVQLFGKYLTATEKIALQNAENSPMGANGEDIRDILKANPVLEVYDSFKMVLEHIRNLTPEKLDSYDMFILDRNLTGGAGYIPQEIQSIDRGFDNFRYEEREGDYLALQLHLKGCPIKEKVFFYSAYKTMSFGATEIEQMVDYGTFFQDNFFDKGQPTKLVELINNQKRASIFAEHRDVFGIINSLSLDIEEEIMRILLEMQKDNAKLTTDWRTVIQSCLKHMTRYEKFWFRYPDEEDTIGPMIGKLDRGTEERPGKTPMHIIFFFDCINKIINSYVAHPNPKYPTPQVSPYAVKAFAYELLEIIVWLGANCK